MGNFKSCNKILINTHKKSNIDLLKARDYYFDIARNLNRVKWFFIITPIAILLLTYIPLMEEATAFIEKSRDYIVGFVTILSYFLTKVINQKISDNLKISNTLREEYDILVLGIKRNKFAYNREQIDKYLEMARYVKDDKKYETWYSEIFCPDSTRNTICCQMDNCIYTYHAYNKLNKILKMNIFFLFILMIFIFRTLVINEQITDAILFMFAAFNLFQVLFEAVSSIEQLVKDNKVVSDMVLNSDDDNYDDIFVRTIQDTIVNSRNHSVFIPKYIRNEFLKDGNSYYKDLDAVKDKLMGSNAQIVTCAEEIPVLPITKEDESFEETSLVNLSDVHNRLIAMFVDIKRVWDENNISYTLDGGSLIGAIREKGKMLFWDDDIDLIIPYHQLDKAKQIIQDELGYKYDLQDFDSEKFYSPRLSNFRIREKNSIINEKDSPLFPLYSKRGIFIDIYVYTPIMGTKVLDILYRLLFIYIKNKRLKDLENTIIYGKTEEKREKAKTKFLKLKARYIETVNRYCEKANSKKYVSYTPNYIESYKEGSPYIPYDALVGERKKTYFVGVESYVPNDAEKVLESIYGENWNISPYKTINELKELSRKENSTEHNWFSHNKFKVTCLKHVTYIDLLKIHGGGKL